MEDYQSIIAVISMTMGVSWASGINLYAALLMLGIGGATGSIDLPPDLEALQNPMVILAAGIMYITEFVADKIPGVDSSRDAIHTFIRIPAGAMLAMGTVGDVTPALEIAAAILGGSMSATSHSVKTGTRLAINTSPEPFTNWGMSVAEDVAVFAGLWAALTNPVVFLVCLILFIFLAIWLLPKIWRGVKFIFHKIGQLLGMVEKDDKGPPVQMRSPIITPTSVSDPDPGIALPLTGNSNSASGDVTAKLEKLKKLRDDGDISAEEYELLKGKVISEA